MASAPGDTSVITSRPVEIRAVGGETTSTAHIPRSFPPIDASYIDLESLHSSPGPQIKSEPPDQAHPLAAAEGDDYEIFEDVDESYEGLAEDEDGVEYFVCEGTVK